MSGTPRVKAVLFGRVSTVRVLDYVRQGVRADVVPLKAKEELPGLVRTRRVSITPLRLSLIHISEPTRPY